MQDLEDSWQQLTARYTTDGALSLQLWQELEKAYTDTGRHYHSLQHLAALLSLADTHHHLISEPDSVAFAIFYHDVVYNALRKDNEERSALMAEERLRLLGLPIAQRQRIEQMILATKVHATSNNADTNLLLDFDLSILGSSWEIYVHYTRQIRKEYSIVPFFLYKKGRKKVLQHLLSLPRIYKTDIFYSQLEAIARENLAQELLVLQ